MTDDHWMNLALEEARKGIGKTAPNPPVGAVIVKNGVLLGSGWHRAAGQPHAEREALADAVENHGRDAVRGATVYITLEPCSTHGRTPPCTQGLIDAGVARVVYACVDRNPGPRRPRRCASNKPPASKSSPASAARRRRNCCGRFSKSAKPACPG